MGFFREVKLEPLRTPRPSITLLNLPCRFLHALWKEKRIFLACDHQRGSRSGQKSDIGNVETLPKPGQEAERAHRSLKVRPVTRRYPAGTH